MSTQECDHGYPRIMVNGVYGDGMSCAECEVDRLRAENEALKKERDAATSSLAGILEGMPQLKKFATCNRAKALLECVKKAKALRALPNVENRIAPWADINKAWIELDKALAGLESNNGG